MKTMGMREARASSDALEKALATEGEIILTNHGKPFARVLPYAPKVKADPGDPDFQRLRNEAAARRAALRASMPFQTISSEVLLREIRS